MRLGQGHHRLGFQGIAGRRAVYPHATETGGVQRLEGRGTHIGAPDSGDNRRWWRPGS
jgi:hypothetical protein